MDDRHRTLATLADRINAARSRRDSEGADSADRQDAQQALRRAKETLVYYLALGRLPASFQREEHRAARDGETPPGRPRKPPLDGEPAA